jgi:hypothetical protein
MAQVLEQRRREEGSRPTCGPPTAVWRITRLAERRGSPGRRVDRTLTRDLGDLWSGKRAHRCSEWWEGATSAPVEAGVDKICCCLCRGPGYPAASRSLRAPAPVDTSAPSRLPCRDPTKPSPTHARRRSRRENGRAPLGSTRKGRPRTRAARASSARRPRPSARSAARALRNDDIGKPGLHEPPRSRRHLSSRTSRHAPRCSETSDAACRLSLRANESRRVRRAAGWWGLSQRTNTSSPPGGGLPIARCCSPTLSCSAWCWALDRAVYDRGRAGGFPAVRLARTDSPRRLPRVAWCLMPRAAAESAAPILRIAVELDVPGRVSSTACATSAPPTRTSTCALSASTRATRPPRCTSGWSTSRSAGRGCAMALRCTPLLSTPWRWSGCFIASIRRRDAARCRARCSPPIPS